LNGLGGKSAKEIHKTERENGGVVARTQEKKGDERRRAVSVLLVGVIYLPMWIGGVLEGTFSGVVPAYFSFILDWQSAIMRFFTKKMDLIGGGGLTKYF
jgi:hypothetical protein